MGLETNTIEEIEDDMRVAKEAAVRVHHAIGIPIGELTLAIFARLGAERRHGTAAALAAAVERSLPAPAAPGSPTDVEAMFGADAPAYLRPGFHVVEERDGVTITADERDLVNGNASHLYAVCASDGRSDDFLSFQRGPVAEVGVNGVQNEHLLRIVIDRLEGFQSSRFACEENALALKSCVAALESLNARTAARKARGVEGTQVP